MKLLDQVRSEIRWLKGKDIESFLTHLAVERNVAASTQNQALNALAFLYQQVLKLPIDEFDQFKRAKLPERLPVVLTQKEILRVLSAISEPTPLLMAKLIYGTGMRLLECIRLRVKDVDLEKKQIIIRQAKGFKDRVVMLPQQIEENLQNHLKRVKLLCCYSFNSIKQALNVHE